MIYLKYIIKRLFSSLCILLIASLLIFFMMRANKIDEVSLVGSAKRMTEETRLELIKEHHLDEPLIVRYGMWLKNALKGDFGKEYQNRSDVLQIVKAKIPITAGLVIGSVVITLIIAIPLGIICAMKRNTWIDTLISVITLFLNSIPNFLLGLTIIIIVAMAFPNYQLVGTYENMTQYFSRLSLPCLALAGSMIAGVARITRVNMIEQLKSGYITAAEAKGMGKINIVFIHAFHNGCLPVLTIITLMVGIMISGSVIIENIFSLPGLGSCLVTAVQTYNYPLVQFLTLVLLAIFLFTSLVVDLLYMIIDPRIRKSQKL